MKMNSEGFNYGEGIYMQMKSECLSVMLENVMQMKFEHLIHMKAKFERLIQNEESINEV